MILTSTFEDGREGSRPVGAEEPKSKTEISSPFGHFGRGRTTMGHSQFDPVFGDRKAWNAGRIVGAKRALKAPQVWAIRFWLDHEGRLRDRALFDLAIDSKLRG